MAENNDKVLSNRNLSHLRRVGRDLAIVGRVCYGYGLGSSREALKVRTAGIIILDEVEQLKENKHKLQG